MGIKKNIKRVDAFQKVTGEAKYVEDLIPRDSLYVKIVHSTIANGIVKKIDTSEALKAPGVEMILTCFDVPTHPYITAGHPLSLDPAHEDVKDKLILTSHVRYYGDDIAAVVADTPLHAQLAAELVHVEYEVHDPLLTPAASINNPDVIHEIRPNNELSRMDFTIKDGKPEFGTAAFSTSPEIAGRKDLIGEHFYTPTVNAVHLENHSCFAYMDGRKIVVYTCNQAPHTVRRNTANALGIPVGDVRVIKPYLGGGFGNKQDTVYEPLVALLTQKLGGRPVAHICTREETFINTRTRHAFDMDIVAEPDAEGRLQKRAVRINSNGGSYAAHGHAITAFAVTTFFQTYTAEERAVDVDGAKKILEDAGIATDGSVELTAIGLQDVNPIYTVMQENLSKIGITLKINITDTPTFVQDAFGGNYDLIMVGEYTAERYPTLLCFMQQATIDSGFVIGGPKTTTPEIDSAITQLIQETDTAKAKEEAGALEKTMKDQCIVSNLYPEMKASILAKNLKGYTTRERGFLDATNFYEAE